MNTERRPQGDHPETGDDLTDHSTPMVRRETCPECERRPAALGWRHCTPCLREYVAGLKRRNAAELRSEPLEVAS